MFVIFLILCVIVVISTLIYRIWSKDTVDYRKLLNLDEVKDEQEDDEELDVDEILLERNEDIQEIKKRME